MENLLATYEVEEYCYCTNLQGELEKGRVEAQEDVSKNASEQLVVSIESATTTRGGQIVSDEHDATGIMIWPATHLLCQYLAAGYISIANKSVCELGCGVGLVGIVAVATRNQSKNFEHINKALWMSTDMDPTVLKLCRKNFDRNGISCQDGEESGSPSPGVLVKVERLEWGNENDISRVQGLMQQSSVEKESFPDGSPVSNQFDYIMGADIVYPSTSGSVLHQMLNTVDCLLKKDGLFLLSFATRDGHRTPLRLIDAASCAGFAISRLDSMEGGLLRRLPPLLDSLVLVLFRSADAMAENQLIGGESCSIFPGLRRALENQKEPSSDEEWDAPFADD